MNTFYGEAGNSLSPMYNILVAGSVTSKGKELLSRAHDIAEANGWKVHYGDTDSLYLSCNAVTESGSESGSKSETVTEQTVTEQT